MTAAGRSTPRSDRAVIMARGLGVRMGGPKGLLRFSSAGPAFVRIIADLYLKEKIPVDVPVLAELSVAHEKELPLQEECRVLPSPPGGDTALTMLMAWRSCRRTRTPCSHFWAHPVDLPLVTAGTIDLLWENSRQHPTRILRPVRDGIPGHPVVLPYDVLAELDRRESFHQGPLREFIAQGVFRGWLPEPVEMEVEDPGIDRDFDRPADLGPTRPGPGKGEFHE
ncbi:MAG: NTP transferase domain-containing protein [Candidatus Krumholzibacteriota bacterium]